MPYDCYHDDEADNQDVPRRKSVTFYVDRSDRFSESYDPRSSEEREASVKEFERLAQAGLPLFGD